ARRRLVVVEVIDVTPRPHTTVDDRHRSVPDAEEVSAVGHEFLDRLDLCEHRRLLVEQGKVMQDARRVYRGQMQSGLGKLSGTRDLAVPGAAGVVRRRVSTALGCASGQADGHQREEHDTGYSGQGESHEVLSTRARRPDTGVLRPL